MSACVDDDPGENSGTTENRFSPEMLHHLPGMVWRGLVIGALLWLVGGGATAFAADPSGPALSFVRLGLKPETSELRISNADGSGSRVIAGGKLHAGPLPYPFSDLAWTPDGSKVIFSAARRSLYRDPVPRRQRLYAADVEAGTTRAIPGTRGALGPVMAPDGQTIAFVRVKHGFYRTAEGRRRQWYRTSLWLVAIDGSELRRIRPWRRQGGEWPESFSPDGRTLLIVRGRGHVVAINKRGKELGVVARDAWDPAYSPDGSAIAFIRLGEESEYPAVRADLFVMNVDGSGEIQLTETPGWEMSPSWDPSGQRILFSRRLDDESELAEMDFGNFLLQINADGTCSTKIFSSPGAAYVNPAWRPGPGRGAGPIVC
jgi:Tol biopolymer transport system component